MVPKELNLTDWALGQFPGLVLEQVFWRGTHAYYIPEGLMVKSTEDVYREANAALDAWYALPKRFGDTKGRHPQEWLRDAQKYLAAHPQDRQTSQKVAQYMVAEAQAWKGFEAALKSVDAALGIK